MRIKKVKWLNHPILGNLEVDFTNSTSGDAYDNVIFAGENGTGKTSILESISTFLNIGSFEYFDFIEYVINNSVYKAVQSSSNTSMKDFFDIVHPNGNITSINSNRNNNPQSIDTNNLDPRSYGCVFSKARADYKTNSIKFTTTKQLDIDKYDNDKEDDFTSLKQLIVDIQNQDNSDYAELNQSLGNNPKSWEEYYPNSKIYRFKKAFDSFFTNMSYEKVMDSNDEKVILFNKNGVTIPIDKLSTGEKQIVFRGIYLLRNNQNLQDSSIMIDEPELSMHPKWQKGILKYYKDIFTENNTQQNVQLFVATHSEYVMESALLNKDKNLTIILKDKRGIDKRGIIELKRIDAPSVLPSITSAETNYLAFDIVSNDYHIELYGYLQNKESVSTVKACDDFIISHQDYNPSIHQKTSSFRTTTYNSLTTYIRNAIDHPEPAKKFSESELRTSIELLIKLCR
ncbi:AAA family ATPase [Mesonia ostreae]|uniref:AAA family ATPase n=1 Tax=Mesonia ostreae TaxID=861110 RepID=A0ABU2KGY5_9FLAO|nr:AAA family ATPase [Mesonia ostreae]MDT0293961.1 AAA family ATPase [Mesonia ostreae]